MLEEAEDQRFIRKGSWNCDGGCLANSQSGWEGMDRPTSIPSEDPRRSRIGKRSLRRWCSRIGTVRTQFFPSLSRLSTEEIDLPMVRLSILKKANSLDTELESLSITPYVVLLDASDNSIKDEEAQLFLSTVVGSIKKLGCQENDVVHRRLGLLARIIHLMV
ncbi:hypothetical protein M0R45_019034 [Rubus argutus]|uniref:Uncharacterized protein n=1 Tax=Rubus argutus TaxID=59490 RepID=A0AAW1X7X7_RUBAR